MFQRIKVSLFLLREAIVLMLYSCVNKKDSVLFYFTIQI